MIANGRLLRSKRQEQNKLKARLAAAPLARTQLSDAQESSLDLVAALAQPQPEIEPGEASQREAEECGVAYLKLSATAAKPNLLAYYSVAEVCCASRRRDASRARAG